MRTFSFQYLIPFIVFIIFLGCASGDATGERERRDRNFISKREIESANVGNMFEVIDRLRPMWLTLRAPMRSFVGDTEVLVFQDNVRLGNLEVLRQIRPDMIESAQFLDASTAQSTLPGISRGQHISGAIVLTSVTRH